jgi:hypothetical protein
MKLRRALAAVVATAVVLPFSAGSAATTLTSTQIDAARSDADWLLSAQLPDGAITHYAPSDIVWPYLAGFAALGLVRATEVTGDPKYLEATWRWLSWYQAHQDANGFVTDYVVENGVLRSTGDMDSTDSYAGMFLLGARKAWAVSGDTARLAGLRAGIEGAVRAIEATQDVDGLTWAKPAWRVKYAMDQSEAYAGLRAAAELAGVLGDSALATRARDDADRLQMGFESLWNPTTGAYDWAKHENGARQPTDWSILYPDALQQAWPVGFGLVSGPRSTELMARFDAAQPNWDRPGAMAVNASGPAPVEYWTVAGWAFARIGQPARAALAGDRMRAAAMAVDRAWPFHTGIAGSLVTLGTADANYLAGTAVAPPPTTTAPTTSTTVKRVKSGPKPR